MGRKIHKVVYWEKNWKLWLRGKEVGKGTAPEELQAVLRSLGLRPRKTRNVVNLYVNAEFTGPFVKIEEISTHPRIELYIWSIKTEYINIEPMFE